MSAAISFRLGLSDAVWAGPIAWGLARAAVTAFPLERVRVAIGRRSTTLGYLVTCVGCVAGELALPLAVLSGLERDTVPDGIAAAIACWAGAWGGALFLDAVLERLLANGAPRESAGRVPCDSAATCISCDQSLAGEPRRDVVVVMSGPVDAVHYSHRTGRCSQPKGQ